MADRSLMFYQESPDFKRNQELARALREQAAAQPVTSTLGGLAKMGSMWASGWMEGEARRREEARKQEFNDTLARALQTAKPWTNPDTGVPDIDAAQTRMSHELASSETTAPLAAQLQFGRLQNQQDMADKLALEREKAKLRPSKKVVVGNTLVDEQTGDVVYRAPKDHKIFTVKSGDVEITYSGVEGDQSTWKRIASAPRTPPMRSQAANILTPDGKQVGGRETPEGVLQVQNEQGEWVAAPRGSRQLSLSVQAANPEGLDSVELRKLRDSVRAAEGNIAELDKTLAALEATPQATGLRGAFIDKVGGLLGQLPVIGESVEEGLETPQVQAVRTRLQSILGRFIGTITGDESGRYSDKDQARAQAAARATDPTASFGQVKAALETLRDIEASAMGREKGEMSPKATVDVPAALSGAPEGARIRNDETGKVYIRRGNKLVEE